MIVLAHRVSDGTMDFGMYVMAVAVALGLLVKGLGK